MFRSFWSGLKALVLGESNEWDYIERRKLVRLQCHYNVEFRVSTRKKFKGTILDMSLKGMKLKTYADLKSGDKVTVFSPVPVIEAKTEAALCRVGWVRKRERDYANFVGLLYADDSNTMSGSWVKYILKQLGFHKDVIYQKRRHVRAECFIPVRVVRGVGKSCLGRLHNLGVGGALVELPVVGGVELGRELQLKVGPWDKFPAFTVSGKVVNVRREGQLPLHGVEFDELSEHQLKRLGEYLFYLLKSRWDD